MVIHGFFLKNKWRHGEAPPGYSFQACHAFRVVRPRASPTHFGPACTYRFGKGRLCTSIPCRGFTQIRVVPNLLCHVVYEWLKGVADQSYTTIYFETQVRWPDKKAGVPR